jgi:hypothetical protein
MNNLVEVIWDDAILEHEYKCIEGIDDMKPQRRCNAGYLAREDDDCIVISFGMLYGSAVQYDANLLIPKGMVREIRELK